MQSLGGSLDSDELVTRVEKMVLEHSRADDEEASRRRAGNDEERRREKRVAALVDHLLGDIYVRWTDYNEYCDPFTECSSTSDTFRHDEDDDDPLDQLTDRATLYDKDIDELCDIREDLKQRVAQISYRLIRQLKSRDRLLIRIKRNCDVITAILQASSLKRRIDSRLRFSIKPSSSSIDQCGDSTQSLDTYSQWRGAMAAVAKLSNGIPTEFRKKVWLSLADHFLSEINIDWEKTKRFAFNERSNPDDGKLGIQIVKDLHRTGCQGFNGDNSENERACLKRVLLAYARWNKRIGYCQGFNIIAALILDVVDRCEEDALKVMIYLIDYVLPERYFVDNLRSLSVDMAVFRQLLKVQLPRLSGHLDRLQNNARDQNTGANYEPPLTNVFTMQWFLTMFGTCLKKETALRVWDCILLDGVDTLIRTAIAIWAKLKKQISKVETADEFYTVMGKLSQDLLQSNLVNGDELIKTMYNMKPTLFDNITELRERFTYNITPFSNNMNDKNGTRSSDDSDEFDEDAAIQTLTCFSGMFPTNTKAIEARRPSLADCSIDSFDCPPLDPVQTVLVERMTLDLSMLRKQYRRLRLRQSQAHVVLTNGTLGGRPVQGSITIKSPSPENHLFTKKPVNNDGKECKRNRTFTAGPQLLLSYPFSEPTCTQVNYVTSANRVVVPVAPGDAFRRLSSVCSDISTTSSVQPMTSADSEEGDDDDDNCDSLSSLSSLTVDDTSSNCSTIRDINDFLYATDDSCGSTSPSGGDLVIAAPPTLLEVAQGMIPTLHPKTLRDEESRKQTFRRIENEQYKKAKQSLNGTKNKLFNPFPCRQKSKPRSRNIMQLGMYAPQNVAPQINTGILID